MEGSARPAGGVRAAAAILTAGCDIYSLDRVIHWLQQNEPDLEARRVNREHQLSWSLRCSTCLAVSCSRPPQSSPQSRRARARSRRLASVSWALRLALAR